MQNNATNLIAKYNSLIKKNDEIYHFASRKFGLSDASHFILYHVRTSTAPLTQSQICIELFIPKQTINSALRKLLDLGFIEQKFAENNKKNKQIYLTASGIDFCEKTVDKIIEAEKKAVSNLKKEEQELFLSIYEKYLGNLENSVNTELLKKD